MAIAQRSPAQTPVTEGPRAKSLRPFERAGAMSLRPSTLEALASFERAALAYPIADLRLRVAAARAMDELRVEWKREALPEDLASEVERWDEGDFSGTRADVELANFAIASLLGSEVRVGEPSSSSDSSDSSDSDDVD
jgi:hypothetical protein